MREIYITIRTIYEKNKEKWTGEYLKGFRDCLNFLLIGIERNPAYNAYLKLEELEKEKDKDAKEVLKLLREKEKLGRELVDLDQKFLVYKEKRIKEFNELKENNDRLGIIINEKQTEISKLNAKVTELNSLLHSPNIPKRAEDEYKNQINQLKRKYKDLSNDFSNELRRNKVFAKLDLQDKLKQEYIRGIEKLINVEYPNTDIQRKCKELRARMQVEEERLNEAYK